MKTIKFIFICAIFILLSQACLYAEESSGVLVFGPSQQDITEYSGAGEDSYESTPGPAIMGDSITGTRIADVTVSQGVTLNEPWQISYVDSPTGVGFTLVEIDKNNKEIPVYDVDSPIRAIGKRFPAGTYKVYPYSAGGVEMGETSVSIQCMFEYQQGAQE
jgi:hypothetical protein